LDNRVIGMPPIQPVSPDNLRWKSPASTRYFHNVTDDGRWAVEAIFVLSKLLLRNDFARLQCDALYPI